MPLISECHPFPTVHLEQSREEIEDGGLEQRLEGCREFKNVETEKGRYPGGRQGDDRGTGKHKQQLDGVTAGQSRGHEWGRVISPSQRRHSRGDGRQCPHHPKQPSLVSKGHCGGQSDSTGSRGSLHRPSISPGRESARCSAHINKASQTPVGKLLESH